MDETEYWVLQFDGRESGSVPIKIYHGTLSAVKAIADEVWRSRSAWSEDGYGVTRKVLITGDAVVLSKCPLEVLV